MRTASSSETAVTTQSIYHLITPSRRAMTAKPMAPITLAPVIVTADAVIAAGLNEK
ncbi:hypothetical protein BH10PSE7_BH10PSE7_37440 [soil metagenome]